MPDASSSRYQSRLFNFVHQRTHGLGDALKLTFRHVQVTVAWSLEALLYPVYLLVQKVFQSGLRQLQPEKQQPQPQLEAHDDIDSQLVETSSFASIPIQRVLCAVENQPTVAQGIASELVSRDLVLVSYENEILNILTLQQQEKLQAQILTEVANYWRNWRLTDEKDEPKQLREIERLLTKLTNGSTESTSSPYPPLGLFDAAVAQLESNALVPMSHVQQRASEFIEVVLTQLNIFIYGTEQVTKNAPGTVVAENWNQKLRIQALISAALNFFFGDGIAKKVKERETTKTISERVPSKPLPQRPRTPTLSNSELEDPWLTFNDLFDESQQIDAPGNNQRLVTPSQTTNPTLPHNPSARYSPKNGINSYQNFFRKLKSGAALTQQQKLTGDLGRIQRRLEEITSTLELQNEMSEGEISQQVRQTTQVETKPDWIETKAKSIGYEKHPLERILEWVDDTMVLLEEMFVKIFQSLQRIFKL
ncbi:MAG: hypothetical protein DSM106950_12885 [Stigonema ocellatum SAG 48.90 = DSM 106950]|nr:hypothetical protein [Stigonema ocellatum SAG 48.90 = DSM 106950]